MGLRRPRAQNRAMRSEAWVSSHRADAAELLEALQPAVALLDEDGCVRLANAALGELVGVKPAALHGTSWPALLAPAGLPAWEAARRDAASGAVGACALALQSADGREVPVEVTLRRSASGRFAMELREAVLPRDAEETLRWIARATAPLTGDDFFMTLMRNLAEAFGMRRAFIAECVDRPTTRVRTLAYWQDACLRPNLEFELAGTPCEMTIRDGRVFCVDEDLSERYAWARMMRLDSYLGAPIFDAGGEAVIGHVAFETSGRIDRRILDAPLFQIFVLRAAAELRRKRAEDVLRASEENSRQDSGIRDFADLAGKPVATTAGSTNEKVLMRYAADHGLAVQAVPAKDYREAFELVEQGRAAALALDDVILFGLRANASAPASFEVVGQTLQVEPYGCMVRKGDPQFKALVDRTIARLMNSGEFSRLYQRWFESPIPPRGANLQMPMSQPLKENLRKRDDRPAN